MRDDQLTLSKPEHFVACFSSFFKWFQNFTLRADGKNPLGVKHQKVLEESQVGKGWKAFQVLLEHQEGLHVHRVNLCMTLLKYARNRAQLDLQDQKDLSSVKLQFNFTSRHWN